jgi:Ca2+-binding RTX toxin-like protein
MARIREIRAITGTAGNDTLVGKDPFGNYFSGLAGNDIMIGLGGNDIFLGGAGDDRMFGNAGVDTLSGGAGNDFIDGGADSDWVNYTDAAGGITFDLSITTAQNTGSEGFDTVINVENINGSRFNDVLSGDTGANTIFGLDGDDTMNGGAGNDTLVGFGGNDSVNGGAGDDMISTEYNSSFGNDTVDGGTGIDTLDYSQAIFGINVDLNITTAQDTGGAAVDVISNVENLIGSNFGDRLTGTDGVNVISGGGGDDIISGNGGNDNLDGGAGSDVLNGGAGDDVLFGGYHTALSPFEHDIMTGGSGADTIMFPAPGASNAGNVNQITDFSHLEGDKLYIHNVSSPVVTTFIGANAFTGVIGQLHVIAGTAGSQIVEQDTNGDTVADLIINVTSATPLVAVDFIV